MKKLTMGCSSVQSSFTKAVESEFARQPLAREEILTLADISHLPAPVQKYITYTGALGKSRHRTSGLNLMLPWSGNLVHSP